MISRFSIPLASGSYRPATAQLQSRQPIAAITEPLKATAFNSFPPLNTSFPQPHFSGGRAEAFRLNPALFNPIPEKKFALTPNKLKSVIKRLTEARDAQAGTAPLTWLELDYVSTILAFFVPSEEEELQARFPKPGYPVKELPYSRVDVMSLLDFSVRASSAIQRHEVAQACLSKENLSAVIDCLTTLAPSLDKNAAKPEPPKQPSYGHGRGG